MSSGALYAQQFSCAVLRHSRLLPPELWPRAESLWLQDLSSHTAAHCYATGVASQQASTNKSINDWL